MELTRLVLVIFFLMSMANMAYAAVFSIVPQRTLPTTVIPGSSVKAYYNITNTTGSFHAGNYLKYLPLNVTQITTDVSVPNLCGATFALAANANCTLELNVTGSVNGNDPNPQDHLYACLGGCTVCCAGTNYPLNVAINNPAAFTTAFITNLAGSNGGASPAAGAAYVYACSIQSNGFFSSCSTAQGGNNFNSPDGIAVTSDTAFVANYGSTTVTTCNLGSGILDNCAQSGNFTAPEGLTLNSAATSLFVANSGAGTFSYCPTSDLNSCSVAGSGFSTPHEVIFNSSGTQAYVSNVDSSIVDFCAAVSGGTLGTCTNSGITGLADQEGMALSPAGNFLYICNSGGANVILCAINEDGTVNTASCAATGGSFAYPTGIVLSPNGQQAYVLDSGVGQIYLCSVNQANGTLSGCTNAYPSDPTFNFGEPYGMTFQ